jgi:hypothetical protein
MVEQPIIDYSWAHEHLDHPEECPWSSIGQWVVVELSPKFKCPVQKISAIQVPISLCNPLNIECEDLYHSMLPEWFMKCIVDWDLLCKNKLFFIFLFRDGNFVVSRLPISVQ